MHKGARNNSAPANWSIVWKECLTRTWRCQADGPRSGQMSIASLLPRHSVISKADRRPLATHPRGVGIAASNQINAGDCCLSAPYFRNVRVLPVDPPKPVHAAGRAMIDDFHGPSAPARVKTCPVCTYTYSGSTCGHCGRTGAGTARVRNTRRKIASAAPPDPAALSIAEPFRPFKGR